MRTSKSAQQGFTLIKLIFAMAGFSIMLIVAVTGFLNAMWIYNQANVSRDNQQQVRRVMEQLAGDIRSSDSAMANTEASTLCLEGTTAGTKAYKLTQVGGRGELREYSLPGDASCNDPDALSAILASEAGNSLFGTQNVTEFSPLLTVTVRPDGPVEGSPQSTVSVSLKVRRGATSPASARERQFNNEYGMSSTYLLRGSE